jgi:N-acetylmuramoyl-L-alanine amidase
MAQYKVLIDPGHGGKDPGATGNGLQEKDITLAISKKVAEILKGKGIAIELTRDSDIYLDLPERIKPCDVSISIHVNAGGGQGLETWVAMFNKSQESKRLGELIHKKILQQVKFADRGIKTKKSEKGNYDYLYMIRKPLGIPVLIEVGFIDNTTDAEILKHEENINKIAGAIANGILEYFGIKKEGTNMGSVFKDVPDNHWAIKDIQWAKEKGLIKGDGNGNFGLGKQITREEFVVVLHRFYEMIGGK